MFSEWDKGITKESFELRLACNDIQRFVYTMIDMKFTLYLIDRQKREVVKIINREITNFFYHKVYMAQIDPSEINVYLEIGNFALQEWK